MTVMTPPCGPWGSWSRLNLARGGKHAEHVQKQCALDRPLLKTTSDAIISRLKAGGHILLENPLTSEYIHQPEMKPVKDLIPEGKLFFLRVDGCSVGYRQQETGEPYLKPIGIITDMEAAADILPRYRCSREHNHAVLTGSANRTLSTAEWPHQFDKIIYRVIEQQILIDRAKANYPEIAVEALPAAARPRASRPRKPRRDPAGEEPFLPGEGVPPPPEPPPPEPVPDAERKLLEGDEARHLNLSKEERARRRRWAAVDPDIRRELRRLHVNLGHVSTVGLLRRLRRAGARPEVIAAAKDLPCDACGDAPTGPSRAHNRLQAAAQAAGEKRPVRPGVLSAMESHAAGERAASPAKSRSVDTDMSPGKSKLKL